MSLLEQVQSRIAAARKALRSASGSVSDIRGAVNKLKSERAAVEAAPIPAAEAAPILEDAVNRLLCLNTHFSTSDLINAAAHGRPIDLRMLSSEQRLQLCVVALRPILLARFHEELTEHYRAITPGLPAAERRQRLAELDGQVVQLEHQEEQLIAELAAAGVDVSRRPDADPAVVLGL